MGYRVVYGQDTEYPSYGRIRTGRTILLSIAAAVLFLGAAYRFWPEGAAVMDRLLSFDGLREVHHALDVMVLELQSGSSLKDAVTVFCGELVNGSLSLAA